MAKKFLPLWVALAISLFIGYVLVFFVSGGFSGFGFSVLLVSFSHLIVLVVVLAAVLAYVFSREGACSRKVGIAAVAGIATVLLFQSIVKYGFKIQVLENFLLETAIIHLPAIALGAGLTYLFFHLRRSRSDA